MKILPRMVMELDLNGGNTTRTYTIAKDIPRSFVEAAEEWIYYNKIDLDTIHTTITDNQGIMILTVAQGRAATEDGLGFLEVELRGLLLEVNTEEKIVVLNTHINPYLHLSNGVLAFCINILDTLDEVAVLYLYNRVVATIKSKGYEVKTYDKEGEVSGYSSDSIIEDLF